MIDVSQASDARIYDYLLGGSDNYPSDRVAARRLLEIAPNTGELARINRQFLARAVRHLAGGCGIGQFLDNGSGLPSRDNVHQVARRSNGAARVVYVDNDPLVHAHARMMLDEENTLILDADMLETTAVLEQSEQAGFINREVPVAALFVDSLHCVADERDPWGRVRDLMDRLPSGSYLVLSHLASDDAEFRTEASRLMWQLTGRQWARIRSFAHVRRFFEGLQPVGGAIGDVARWRAGGEPQLQLELADTTLVAYGGVARKP